MCIRDSYTFDAPYETGYCSYCNQYLACPSNRNWYQEKDILTITVEPSAPTEDQVKTLLADGAVTIDCTNEEVSHADKTYGLLAGGYTIGAVQGNSTSGYTVEVSVTPAAYVAQYNTCLLYTSLPRRANSRAGRAHSQSCRK